MKKMKKRRIVIVDDHEIFRDGLRLVLEQIDNFEVVNEFGSGADFAQEIEEEDCDVVLLDINMPGLNGIKVTEIVKKKYAGLKIIGLSMLSDEVSSMKMIKCGADGFVQKKSGKMVLEHAINTVCQGGNYFSQDILKKLAIRAQRDSFDSINQLTSRENEVLIHICQGESTKEIAETLFLSPKTVEVHRANILSKTYCKNSAQLVIWAIKNQIYTVY